MRKVFEREGVSQLLSRPLRGWMTGHVKVNNATAIMGQNQKHIEDLETNCWNREEVNRDKLREVVLEKGTPSLRGPPTGSQHVFTDARLADVDAELEQFSVNTRCAPSRILPTHPTDQVADFVSDGRTTRLSVPDLPRPEEAKSSAVPGDDGLRFHDDQCRAPILPDAGQARPEEAIS